MWIFLVGCVEKEPPSSPVPEDSSSTPPIPSTETTPPAETGDTSEPTVPTVPADCTNLPAVLAPLTNPTIDTDPLPFDPRVDGTTWFGAADGIYQGDTPSTASLVWPARDVWAVREAVDGTLWFAADGAVSRVLPGGAPEVVVADVPYTNDIEILPTGAILFASWDIPADVRTVVFVEPNGVPEVHEADVQAVAWAPDGATIWLLGDGLWSLPAGTDGRPDWTVAPTQVLGPQGFGPLRGDLAVDACGNVLVLSFGLPFGDVIRYDPTTGSSARLPGNDVDQGYGLAPLRFGRFPGTETLLRTSSGGWSTARVNWVTWDLGVGGP